MSRIGKLIIGKRFLLQRCGTYKLHCQKRTFMANNFSQGEKKYKTMQEIRHNLIALLETEYNFTTEPKSREHLLKFLPKTQEELPVRKMKDSFDWALVPLSSDLELRDKYTTFSGNVRLGRLMEDMDMFAAYVAHKHVVHPNKPPQYGTTVVIVTVAVSQIDCLKQPKTSSDIRLSGHVCWVGKSSLEVAVRLDQEVNGKWQPITRALLLMAARNSTNTGAAIVNPIEAETPEEQELLKGGENRKIRRQKMMNESLLKTVPTEEELHLIHDLFMDTIDSKEMFVDKMVLPPNSKWMHDATLNNLVFCHPEHRNLHNKIFGGFLIRQALELSWSIGFLHMMRVPKLIHISDIGFYKPVEVGSLLKLYSSITYTDEEHIQVFVCAEAFSSLDFKGKSTTGFNFTYRLGKPVDKVYPSTYLEAMKYIDGRRHLFDVMHYGLDGKKRTAN